MLLPTDLLPIDEAERLLTLRHYRILDAQPEAVLQEVVALAAHVFGLPASFLALVDEHEVHFPAVHGVALPPVPRVEVVFVGHIAPPCRGLFKFDPRRPARPRCAGHPRGAGPGQPFLRRCSVAHARRSHHRCAVLSWPAAAAL